MTQSQALRRLLAGIERDRAGYAALDDKLAQQFSALLARDASELAGLAAGIAADCDELDKSRRERNQLLALLGCRGASAIYDAIALLPSPAQAVCEQRWRGLRAQVTQCQQANQRNGQLLQQQHAAIEQVLHGERDVYVES